MFKAMTERWQAEKAVKELEIHPIFGPVLIYARGILGDKSQGLGQHFDHNARGVVLQNLVGDLNSVLSMENPNQMVRHRTGDFILLTSKLDVLIIQPPGIFPGVTGEMSAKLMDIVAIDKELQDYFQTLKEYPRNRDECWNAILTRYWLMHLYLNIYNVARRAIGDYNEDPRKDWFRPFYISSCINYEADYRQKLGLPTVLPEPLADLKAIAHGAWANRLLNNVVDLRYDWEKSWREAFHEASPYEGLAL